MLVKNNNRLKELRINHGYTLDDIESKTGIKRGTYSNYENHNTEPKLETWQKLAKLFDVSVPYLQGESNIKDPSVYEDLKKWHNSIRNYETHKGEVPFSEFVALGEGINLSIFKNLEDLIFSEEGLFKFHSVSNKRDKDCKELAQSVDYSQMDEINFNVFEVFKLALLAKSKDKKYKRDKEAYEKINKIIEENEK